MVCQQPRFGRELGDLDLLVYAKTSRFKLKRGKELTMYNHAKFYSPTSKRKVGYTDYLTWEEAQKRVEK